MSSLHTFFAVFAFQVFGLLLENGEQMLTESGDFLILE
jgi:hypothetical protein